MIDGAYISHFKSINEISVRFQNLNIVVGSNGVGKSNIIDAIYFIRDCIIEDLDTAITKRHGIESVRQWSRTRPYNLTIELTSKTPEGNGKYKLVLASARGDYKVMEEHGEWYGEHPFAAEDDDKPGPLALSTFHRDDTGQITLSNGFDDDFFRETPKRIGGSDLYITAVASPAGSLSSYLFKSLASSLSEFVSYSIYPNTLRAPQPVSKDPTLFSNGSNLGSILKRLNSGSRRNKDRLMSALRVVMPSATEIIVKSIGGYYAPSIRVSESHQGAHDFNMSQISDGTLRILGLLTAFYQPLAPDIIAVEEPEQMIHPGLLPIIGEAAMEFVHEKKESVRQVFITTHSPTMLDLFKPDNILWANFSDGITTCGPISPRQLDLIRRKLFTAGEVLLSEGFFE